MKKTHVKAWGGIFATWTLQRALFAIVAVIAVTVLSIAVSQVRADDGSAGESTDERIITLYDRGVERSFMTTAGTIGDALKEAGVEIDTRDRVEPAMNEDLVADKYSVNVYRARPLLIVDGSRRNVVMTAAQVPEEIAKDADLKLYPEDIAVLEQSDSILVDRAAERFVVNRATEFEFTLYGETFTARTQATTVGEMLKDKGIKLGENDDVSTGLDTPIEPGMSIRVWREGKQTITVNEKIDFEVEKIQDANREADYRQVRTAGEKGEAVVTYEVTIRDGKEVSRKKISSVVTKPPVKQVEIVGTKNNYSGSLNEWLLALRTCESGGNYRTSTGNGFYGAYQFMQSTWDRIASMVGREDLIGVRPSSASPADQDMMIIANTNLSAGLSTQNPGFYSSLGLSNKPPQ